MLSTMTNAPTHETSDTSPAAGLVTGPALPLASHAGILAELESWAAPHADGALDAAQLAAILAHSRHLQGLARAHPDIITPILRGEGENIVGQAMSTLETAAADIDDETQMMAAVRRLRQQSALAVALSDMAGTASVETQMTWLSEAAVSALRGAVTFLFRQAARRGLLANEEIITVP